MVRPLFCPGGDIGKLAVAGTVNDLAMCGARPLYLSAGFILEEGLPIETLRRVVDSMRQVAIEAGVQFVTGDTKVVDRGRGDGLYINTARIGIVERDQRVAPLAVQPGDVQAACEILGLDPMYVVNEGRFIAIVGPADAERAVRIMRRHEVAAQACVIGQVLEERSSRATMTSLIGVSRIVDLLSGEQLPRIC